MPREEGTTVLNDFNKPLAELEHEIKETEKKLEALRMEHRQRTGQVPPRSFSDYSWRWAVFMVLGFAFISCMVYLLGIGKSGRDAGSGIPDIFFQTDVMYFAILTFFVIFMALLPLSRQLAGYQVWIVVLGFWCAHWLIYDWAWHAINFGFGVNDEPGWWTKPFYAPLLIPHPPMWLFLVEALLGGLMALYTFTVPKNYRSLLPPVIWLYTVYGNASVMEMLGISVLVTLIVGVILIGVAFVIALGFSIQNMRKDPRTWKEKMRGVRESFRSKNWILDPLSLPWVLIIIIMLSLMHLFLVVNPLVGFFLGMIPWFFIPGIFLLFQASGVQRYPRGIQAAIGVGLTAFVIIALVFLSYAA